MTIKQLREWRLLEGRILHIRIENIYHIHEGNKNIARMVLRIIENGEELICDVEVSA